MPIGFPASPTTGQQWPVIDPRWEWDGTKWTAIGGSGVPGSATPVTRRLTALTNTVDFIGIDGTGPALVAASVIADYAGSPPAATAPAVMTIGQWTVVPITGGLRFDIDAAPADGGSPITGYQYSTNNGSTWTAFSGGAALGPRDITGLAATPLQSRVRAVNAVGPAPDPGSDTKTETPLAGGGGAAAYGATGAYSFGTGSVTINRPAGATTPAQQISVLVWSTNGAGPATMATPTGWTAGPTQTNPAEGRACRLFTAPGDVTELTFTATGNLGAVAWSTNAPLLAGAGRALEAVDYSSPVNSANRPSPSVDAPLNGLVVSVYVQYDDGTGGQMPTPGTVTPYTRQYHLNAVTAPFISILSRAGVAAGATGTITHDALGGFSGRFQFTGAYGS
jgi:large repetitive protein